MRKYTLLFDFSFEKNYLSIRNGMCPDRKSIFTLCIVSQQEKNVFSKIYINRSSEDLQMGNNEATILVSLSRTLVFYSLQTERIELLVLLFLSLLNQRSFY